MAAYSDYKLHNFTLKWIAKANVEDFAMLCHMAKQTHNTNSQWFFYIYQSQYKTEKENWCLQTITKNLTELENIPLACVVIWKFTFCSAQHEWSWSLCIWVFRL